VSEFNTARMEEGMKAMASVNRSIAEFQKVYDQMSEAERWATGGMIYSVSSVWGNFSAIGFLAQVPFARAQLDSLALFINRRDLFPRQDDKKEEVKADKE